MSSDLFERRASQRGYLSDEVPQELIDKILEAARQAPSAGNLQPWHFVAVRNPEVKQALCDHAYRQAFIAQAPVVLVVCAEPERSAKKYGDRGTTLYCLQDTAAAIQNILLCATENGLGTCWCGAFDEEAVHRVLHLHKGLRPIAVIPIGYPSREAKKPARRPLMEIVTFVD